MTTAALPLPSPAAEAFFEKVRLMLAAELPLPGERIWSLMNRGERRAMLRRAALDAELARSEFRQLTDAQRVAIGQAWLRLRDRVLYLAAQEKNSLGQPPARNGGAS